LLRVYIEIATQRRQPPLAVLLLLVLAGATGCAGTPTSNAGAAGTSDATSLATTRGTAAAVPGDVLALHERGLAALAAGELEAARRAFDAALTRMPGLPGPAVNLAIIAQQQGDADAAMAMLDSVIARSPDFAPAHHQRGLLLRERGEFLAADEAYAQAIALDPGYLTAHFNRAVLNDLFLARPEIALRHFTRYQDLIADMDEAAGQNAGADATGDMTPAEDPRVARWIVELNRRVERSAQAGGAR
jgi:tetratricopeptide (TPR) repeat protein